MRYLDNTPAIHTYCRPLNYITQSSGLHLSQLIFYPIPLGRTNQPVITLRKILLSKIQGACITSVRFEGVVHEYSNLFGVRESIHEILFNLRDVVVQSDTHEPQTAFICFQGPGTLTASAIRLPYSVKIVNKTQHIAELDRKVELKIELTVKRRVASSVKSETRLKGSVFQIDEGVTPVKNVDYHIYYVDDYLEGRPIVHECLFFSMLTDGSMSPEALLRDAIPSSFLLLQTFWSFTIFYKPIEEPLGQSTPPPLSSAVDPSTILAPPEQASTLLCIQGVGVEELHLPTRATLCLKRAGIHTLVQLVGKKEEDLLKIKQLGKRSVALIVIALQQRFDTTLAVSPNRA